MEKGIIDMDRIAFKRELDLTITAAQIGISYTNWDYVDHGVSKNIAVEKMKSHRYDILPIKDKDGEYRSFWATENVGSYDKVKVQQIQQSDAIYYLTELKDLLARFQESSNSSFFLTDYSKIIGLVSNVNLNSKPVYVYFYNLISSLEIEIGKWILTLIPESELIMVIEDKVNNSNDKLSNETLLRYQNEIDKNNANHFVEYLYFSQLQYIFKKKKLISFFGFSSNTQFEKEFSIISKYRNWIAHPLNSSDFEMSKDLFELYGAIEKINNTIKSVSLELVKSYYTTTYKTIEEPLFSISIGVFNKNLNQYLKNHNFSSWAFITAENPYSKRLNKEDNKKRNCELELTLKKNRFKYMKGVGEGNNDHWDKENSFLIFGINKIQADKLAIQFQQNAYVYGEINKTPILVKSIKKDLSF